MHRPPHIPQASSTPPRRLHQTVEPHTEQSLEALCGYLDITCEIMPHSGIYLRANGCDLELILPYGSGLDPASDSTYLYGIKYSPPERLSDMLYVLKNVPDLPNAAQAATQLEQHLEQEAAYHQPALLRELWLCTEARVLSHIAALLPTPLRLSLLERATHDLEEASARAFARGAAFDASRIQQWSDTLSAQLGLPPSGEP